MAASAMAKTRSALRLQVNDLSTIVCRAASPSRARSDGSTHRRKQGRFQRPVYGRIEKQRVLSIGQDFSDVLGVGCDDRSAELKVLEKLQR